MSDLTFTRIKDIQGEPAASIENQFFAMDSDAGTKKVILSSVLDSKYDVKYGAKISTINYTQTYTTASAQEIGKFTNGDGDETTVSVPYTPQPVDAEINENSNNPVANSAIANKFTEEANARTSGLAGKVSKVDGKGLSTNDYTTEEKTKLGKLGLTYTGAIIIDETHLDKIITLTGPTEQQFTTGTIISVILNTNPSPLTIASTQQDTIKVVLSEDEYVLSINGTTTFEVTWYTGQVVQLWYNGSGFNLLGQNKASNTTWGETRLLSNASSQDDNREDVAVTPKYVNSKAANNITTTNWLDQVYPVGSIYLTLSSAEPSATFGGNWQRIEGKFLLAAGGTYSAFAEGGSATTQIATTNLPKITGETANSPSLAHYHKMNYSETTGSGSNRATPVSWNDSTGNKVATSTSYKSGDEATLVHKHSFTINNGGDNPTALNTMPPYLVVYAWVRLADNETEISSLQTTQEEEIEVN